MAARNGSAARRSVPACSESCSTSTDESSAWTSSWSSRSFAVPVNRPVSRKLRSSHQPVLATTKPMPPSTSRTVAPTSRNLRRSTGASLFDAPAATAAIMGVMDDELLDDDQRLIADAVRTVCAGFDDDYWARCDREHEFPWDFY